MGGAPGRSLRAVVVALSAMLVLGAGLGGVVWWLGHDSASRIAAGQYAARAAKALSEGQLPADLDTSDREALAREHAAILDGMGGLRPTVKVSSVTLAQGERAGVVTFDYTWKPLPDKAAWSYATTMRILALTGGDRVSWRGTWNPALIAPGLEPGQRLRATRLDSVRADIVSADGDALVTARPVTRVGIDKTREDDPLRLRASARALAQRVGINEDDYLAAVAAAGPQAFVEAIVYRDSATELITLSEAAANYPGLRLVPGELPLAPYARFARPILGTVGLATAELIEKSDGRIRAGDVVGLSGLQQAHDADLAGRDGFRIEVVANGDTDRAPARDHVDAPASGGGRAGLERGRDTWRLGHRGHQTLDHARAGRRQRERQQGVLHRYLGSVSARVDVQDGHRPAAAARRVHPRLAPALRRIRHR